MQRKSRRGKVFYSCSTYPKCDYAVWNEPVAEPCPNCGWPVLTIKTTKRAGTQKVCPQQECSFAEAYEPPPEKPSEGEGAARQRRGDQAEAETPARPPAPVGEKAPAG